MKTLTVTLDTNVLDEKGIALVEAAASGLPVEFAQVTVSEREQRGTSLLSSIPAICETEVWDESEWGLCVWGGPIAETGIVGESEVGTAVVGPDESVYEAILNIIGNGSFPRLGSRDSLTDGQRHQLRDAMILEAHWREGRHILVTNDKRAFVGKDGSRRTKLEVLCSTKIMTVEEFCDHCRILCQGDGA